MDDFGSRRVYRSALPYHVQLKESLRQRIKLGEWKPGSRLPSEPDLCQTYGVSRTVVRQALGELELEGQIIRRRGKGTFVAEPKINESLIQKLTGFYQDMTERGHKIITQVLRSEVEPANPQVASYLKCETGTRVFCIERLRFLDGVPIVLVTSYLPYALCPELGNYDLSTHSLYAILEKEFGLVLSHGRRTIEAVPAREREAELLQIEDCDPLILLNSVTYLEDNTPIEYYHAVHRGDRSRFEVELVRIREEGNLEEELEEKKIILPSSH